MALEATFQELPDKLSQLHTSLKYLEVFIEDRPRAHKLADDLAEVVTDLWSRIGWALEAAEEARTAVEHPTDLARARLALTNCQEQFNLVSRRLLTELMSEPQLTELVRLGRRLGSEWRGWADSVKQALDQCQPPLYEVNQSLFECWQEMAERVGTTSVSVQATNIGQKITISEDTDVMPDRIT